MDCTPFLIKIIPLYFNIVLGYIAGKLLDVSRDSVARLMFFMITPLIIFNGVLHVPLKKEILSLPLITFFVSCLLCLLVYWRAKKIWRDSTKNIAAFAAGTGNTGYFGLALALFLFSPEIEGIYIMANMGVTLYENTLGYYVCAKGVQAAKNVFSKLIKLPTLYAFICGLTVNSLNMSMPDMFYDFISQIKGVYTVMGMMIIGLGLASLKNFKMDYSFIGLTFAAKFIAWPFMAWVFYILDSTYFGFFNTSIYRAVMLLSIVPMAVNTVVMASLLQAQPEKAATAVLLSTLFALAYVPWMVGHFLC